LRWPRHNGRASWRQRYETGTRAPWVHTLALRAAAAFAQLRGGRGSLVGTSAPVAGFGTEFDRLWASIAPSVAVGLVRDAAYLNWRYVANPAYRYHRLALHDAGRLRGLVVGSARRIFGVDAMLLVDLVAEGGEPAIGAALLHALVADARRQDLGMIAALAIPGSILFTVLRRCGFVRVPGRLDPRPFRTAGVVFDPTSGRASNPAAWYFSWGDTDVV
jgi:hypothetical protein